MDVLSLLARSSRWYWSGLRLHGTCQMRTTRGSACVAVYGRASNAGWMIMLLAFLLVGKAAKLHQGPFPPSMQQMAVFPAFPQQMMPQCTQLVPRQISQPQPKLSPVQQQGNAFGVQPNKASSPGHGPSSAGVGLYFKMDSLGRYFVEMVLPKSSAEATGVVTKGDILEVVDDTPTQGVSLPQLRDLILGPPGTYVNLNFLREKGGEGFRYDIDLIRGDPMELPGVAEHAAEENALSPGKAASPSFQRTAAHKAQRYAAPERTRPLPPAESQTGDVPKPFGVAPPPTSLDKGQEVDTFKSKYLAEARMHQEAQQEVQLLKNQISSLQKMVAQLQTKATMDLSNPASVLDDEQALQAGYVPKSAYADMKQKVRRLEQQVMEQGTNPSGGDEQIRRMCVMALPAAVSALHSLSEETGHASSATWALVRAEDYVAHLASLHFPLSIPSLVSRIHGTSTEKPDPMACVHDSQDACLAMSVISWDPEGRNMLLRDDRTVGGLLRIVANAQGALPTTAESDRNSFSALDVTPPLICARFAAMTLGNFSLDEGGRQSIVQDPEAIDILVDAIRGDDIDISSFALLCAGNLFMISAARQKVIALGGALDAIFAKLSSAETMTVRFAAGAVRNFASDDACREALTKVRGSVARLQELSRNQNPRVRDHAEHALYNLRMMRPRGPASTLVSTHDLDMSDARLKDSASSSKHEERSALDHIGSNLFGMA